MKQQKYRPLYKLDSGGMAEVYVAEAMAMAGFTKKVAVKRILPGLIKEKRFVHMFLDEARLSLRFNHANIVSVFDIGESDNTYFIVMEFIEGINLKSVLEHHANHNVVMPVSLVLWILNEVLRGLQYAHSLTDPETKKTFGIVHRDISPPNILISWNGEVKITDFGLAKATTQLESTDPGVVKGKFSYLSPEAAFGREVDHRADLFAVGILAFEMLTGKRLFKGATDYETVQLVRAAQVPDITVLNPQVSPQLAGIIGKALTLDPADRYASADAFAEELTDFLFAHNLKVSYRDLVQHIGKLRRESKQQERKSRKQLKEERSPGGHNLIVDLIQEEMLHFRSLGIENSSANQTGSQPIVEHNGMISSSFNEDPSRPISPQDFNPLRTDKASASHTISQKLPIEAHHPSIEALQKELGFAEEGVVGHSKSQSVDATASKAAAKVQQLKRWIAILAIALMLMLCLLLFR